jgi:hypothetical protein
MSWEALGAIAETVGAMATILMLWYLARQIGQNTHATKFASFQTANSEITQLLQMDPEYAHTLLAEVSDLQERELVYAMNRLTGFFNIYEVLFHQYREGGVEEEVWKSREEQIRLWLQFPVGRLTWEDRKIWYSEPFRKHVDELAGVEA